jgi:hypothetical protein
VELDQQSRSTCGVDAVGGEMCLSLPNAPGIATYPECLLNRRLHGLTNHCLTVSSCTSHPS